jgi:hypothetical protein
MYNTYPSHVTAIGQWVNDFEVALEGNHDNVIVGRQNQTPHPRLGVPPSTRLLVRQSCVSENNKLNKIAVCQITRINI